MAWAITQGRLSCRLRRTPHPPRYARHLPLKGKALGVPCVIARSEATWQSKVRSCKRLPRPLAWPRNDNVDAPSRPPLWQGGLSAKLTGGIERYVFGNPSGQPVADHLPQGELPRRGKRRWPGPLLRGGFPAAMRRIPHPPRYARHLPLKGKALGCPVSSRGAKRRGNLMQSHTGDCHGHRRGLAMTD